MTVTKVFEFLQHSAFDMIHWHFLKEVFCSPDFRRHVMLF